jgi:hypothetical protein
MEVTAAHRINSLSKDISRKLATPFHSSKQSVNFLLLCPLLHQVPSVMTVFGSRLKVTSMELAEVSGCAAQVTRLLISELQAQPGSLKASSSAII